jgi:thiol-disulfide isomerase/thioredoxin
MDRTLDTPEPPPIEPSEPGSSPVRTERRALPLPALLAAAVAGALAAIFLVVLAVGGDEAPAEGGDDLAALAFLATDGSTATLADYRGEPLVVNFFASWCAPCRAELPDLERVHEANEAVTFLGINHDLDEATWRSFVAETEITYDTGFQPETEIFTALGALGMPSTALLSADGEVLHLHTGLLTDDMLQDLIDEHLADKA